MVTSINNTFNDLTEDFVPQAIFDLPMSYFLERSDTFYEGDDDLDAFIGILFTLANGTIFEIKRYAGFPENTVSLYMPDEIEDVDFISDTIGQVIEEFKIPEHYISWQRKDDYSPVNKFTG